VSDVVVHELRGAWGLPSISPFCLKLQTWLRIAGVPYSSVRGVRKQLVGHGMGKHSAEEIHAIGRRDIGALADVLGDRPFLFGDAPTGFDAVAYGFLANILEVPITSPVKDEGLRRANLPSYLARMRSRFWPAPCVAGSEAARAAAVSGLG
jgi:hypothetical protein